MLSALNLDLNLDLELDSIKHHPTDMIGCKYTYSYSYNDSCSVCESQSPNPGILNLISMLSCTNETLYPLPFAFCLLPPACMYPFAMIPIPIISRTLKPPKKNNK